MGKDAWMEAVERREWSDETIRETFAQFLGDFPEAAAIFDDDLRIIVANDAYAELTGFAHDEIETMTAYDVVADSRARLQGLIDQLNVAGRQNARITLRRATGEICVVDYTARTQLVPGRHIAFMRDVTNSEENERQLRLRAGVLDSLEDGVYVLDPAGTITVWNRAAEEITGHSAADAIGARVEDLGIAPQAELDAAGRRVLEAMASERGPDDPRPRSVEVTGLRRRKDGSIYSSWAEVSPLREESGAYMGVLVMLHDLSRERDREPTAAPSPDDVGGLLVSVGREAIAGRPPGPLLEFAVDRLRECLQVDLVGSWRMDARTAEVVLES